jgi:hypothetical protein
VPGLVKSSRYNTGSEVAADPGLTVGDTGAGEAGAGEPGAGEAGSGEAAGACVEPDTGMVDAWGAAVGAGGWHPTRANMMRRDVGIAQFKR